MSEERKQTAESRLADALDRGGLDDTRPLYRRRLRQLRETDPAVFERALRHYDEVVLPALAGAADAVETWIHYGRWLADLTTPGRLFAIGIDGRAVACDPPYPAGTLVLHLPDDPQAPPLPAMVPAAPSPAQEATYGLLVLGHVAIGSAGRD